MRRRADRARRTCRKVGIRTDCAHQSIEIQSLPIFKHEGALQFVRQFADVARPTIGQETAAADRREDAGRHVMLARKALEQRLRHCEDILAPFPQRWDGDPKQVQAMVEILAEHLGDNHFAQIPIGGCDETSIDRDVAVSPHATNPTVLNGSQEFCLECWREAGDLIEKKRAAASGLKQSEAGDSRVGERALFMTEQFRLGQIVGNGGTIGFDQRSGGARALRMNPACQRGLAGSGFALNQHRRQVAAHALIGADDLAQLRLQRFQRASKEEVLFR